LYSDPAIGPDGTIYFGCDDGNLYALTAQGMKEWSLVTDTAGSSAPVIGPDCTIYFGASDRNFYAIRPDGSKRWQYPADGAIGSAASVAADGTIFFGTSAGSLYALRSDGTLLWRNSGVGRMIGGSLLLADGRLVFGTSGGPLFALRTAQQPAELHWPTLHAGAQRGGRAQGWLHLSGSDAAQFLHAGESFSIVPQWNLAGRAMVRAELVAGTNVVGVNTDAPFELTWTNATAGTNRVFVTAVDNTGCVYQSDVVTLIGLPLRLRPVFALPNELRLSVNSLPDRSYTLQSTTNLARWDAVSSQPTTVGEEIVWVVENVSCSLGLRAFRVSVSR